MSTSSNSSFELISDPEDSDGSSMVLVGALNPEHRFSETSSNSSFEHFSETESLDSIPAAVAGVSGSVPAKRAAAPNQAEITSRIRPAQRPKIMFLLFCLCLSALNHSNQPANLPGDRKFQEEVDTMLRRVNEIRSNLTKITCLEDVPEKLMSKWKPDISRFIGLNCSGCEKYKDEEALLKTGTPVFEWTSDNNVILKFYGEVKGKIGIHGKLIFNKGCVYISDCGLFKVYIKDGDLYLVDNVITLVYTIPAGDLI